MTGERTFSLSATIVLGGIFLYRVIRTGMHFFEVLDFYGVGRGIDFWCLFLILPFAALLLTGAGAWLSGRTRIALGAAGAILAGVSFLYEALVAFARMMNGNTGYVGASPVAEIPVGSFALALVIVGVQELQKSKSK